MAWLRRSYPTVFIAVFEPSAAQDPCFRMTCFDEGVNMVAHDVESILTTLEDAVTGAGRSGGRVYSCPYCNMPNLSERDLYYHCPAFHINVPNDSNTMDECPICRTRIRGPLQVLDRTARFLNYTVLYYTLYCCNLSLHHTMMPYCIKPIPVYNDSFSL